MKKRIKLIIFGILATAIAFTGCKPNSAASKQEATVTTKVEQPSDTNTADKKVDKIADDKKDEAKTVDTTKTDDASKAGETAKTDGTKSAAKEEQKAPTENKASSPSTPAKSNPAPATHTVDAPKPVSTPAPEQNKPSGLASFNDEFRFRYLRLCPGNYNGIKKSTFCEIVFNVANGSLSQDQAISKIKAIGTWKEDDRIYNISGTPRMVVYYTATDNALKIIGEMNDRGYFLAGTVSDAYAYYDSASKKNRIVVMGTNLGYTIPTTIHK